VPFFSISKVKGQGDSSAAINGRPHNMSALGRHIFLVLELNCGRVLR